MSIDRVATNTQSSYMLDQLNRITQSLTKHQQQVASGKVAGDYAGYGDKVAVLEAARSAGARLDAYKTATQQAINQTDLQDTQITSLADLAAQLRQALTNAVGQNNGQTLMTEASGIFNSALQILNAKNANGKYIYGGEKNDTPPFTATSLADLAALPDVSDAFANGTLKTSVLIGDGQTVQVGQLADEMGSGLMSTLRSLAQYVNGNGDFGESMTGAQADFLTGQIASAKSASDGLNSIVAGNGFTYSRLKDTADNQEALSTMYGGFVSDIEDVDMPTAITKLNQNQVALQAALQVTAQLQQVSLLNYLGQ